MGACDPWSGALNEVTVKGGGVGGGRRSLRAAGHLTGYHIWYNLYSGYLAVLLYRYASCR